MNPFAFLSPFSGPIGAASTLGAFASLLPGDAPGSNRRSHAMNVRDAYRGFMDGQPLPGQELGANLPTTMQILRRIQERMPNPHFGGRGAQSFDEAGFIPAANNAATRADIAAAAPSPTPSAPPPAQASGTAAASPAPATPASPSPSLPPGLLSPTPLAAPQSFSAPAVGGGSSPAPAPMPAPPPMNNVGSTPAPTMAPPGLYNGPGSMNFGATTPSAGIQPFAQVPQQQQQQQYPGGQTPMVANQQNTPSLMSGLNSMFGGGNTSNPFGNGLLANLANIPSQLGGLFNMSQTGPTFANGSNGMMGGVPFTIA